MLFWLVACDVGVPARPDGDGDGWADGPDCDDADPAVHPDADEVCGNAIDDDCDLAAPGCGLFGELALGEPTAVGTSAGAALGTVLAGGPLAAATAPGAGVVLLADGTWFPAPDAGFGASLASADGALLIGDPDAAEATLAGSRAGTFTGPDGSRMGQAVAFVGNNVAIGAAEAVYVFDASGDGVAQVSGDATALAGGDLDGDGLDDLATAAPPEHDEDPFAWVFPGPLDGSIAPSDADAVLTGFSSSGAVAIAGPCDIDGDGAVDLLITVGNELWYVTAATLDWLRVTSGGGFVAACGDADGDGLAEVALADSRSGRVEVDAGDWSGIAWLDVPEDEPITVAFATGADGYASLLVGLPASDEGAGDGGAVWILPGGPGF
jgi:hypothetical protein